MIITIISIAVFAEEFRPKSEFQKNGGNFILEHV